MKQADYAIKVNKPVSEVVEALSATGQSTHPNKNVDESVLDSYFAGTWTPSAADQAAPRTEPTLTPPVEDGEQIPPDPVVSETDPNAKPKSTKKKIDPAAEQRPAPAKILGEYERGMKIWEMVPKGPKSPLPALAHRAYGHDPSQAIANILKHYGNVKSELVSWKNNGSVTPTQLSEA